MYLGYQNGKIKFYTEEPLDKEFYNLDEVEETNLEYVLDNEEYVLKDEAWEEKQAQKERERLNLLSMTKREMFLGLYQAKGITPDVLKSHISEPAALIEFEYANDYYRGNPLIDVIGTQLGFTTEQLDRFFETKDYRELMTVQEETEANGTIQASGTSSNNTVIDNEVKEDDTTINY